MRKILTKKTWIAVMVAVMIMCCCFFSACSDEEKLTETEGFVLKDLGNNTVAVFDIPEEYKEESSYTLPATIDGKTVVQFGYERMLSSVVGETTEAGPVTMGNIQTLTLPSSVTAVCPQTLTALDDTLTTICTLGTDSDLIGEILAATKSMLVLVPNANTVRDSGIAATSAEAGYCRVVDASDYYHVGTTDYVCVPSYVPATDVTPADEDYSHGYILYASASDTTMDIGAGLDDFDTLTLTAGALRTLSLTDISLSDSVTTIADGAFAAQSELQTLTFGAGLRNIDFTIYQNEFPLLTAINVDNANTAFRSVDGVLYTYALDSLVLFPRASALTTLSMPATVTAVSEYAAFGATQLQSIDTANVTTFGDYALSGSGITALTLTGITKVPNGLAKDCAALTTVTLSDSVLVIGTESFMDCAALTTINTSHVIYFYPRCFMECVVLETDPTAIAAAKIIYNSAFSGCTALSGLTVGNTLERIEEEAFADTAAFTEVVFGKNFNFLGSRALAGCTSLEAVQFTNSRAFLSAGAFEGCTALATLTLPEKCNYLSDDLLRDCTGLRELFVPATVAYIGATVFYGCEDLEIHFRGKRATMLSDVGAQSAKDWNKISKTERINENDCTVTCHFECVHTEGEEEPIEE